MKIIKEFWASILCAFLAITNIYGMTQGNWISYVSFIICSIMSVFCLYLAMDTRRINRKWK